MIAKRNKNPYKENEKLQQKFLKEKALFLNLLVALTAILGALFPFILQFNLKQLDLILPIIAGGFIYICWL